MVTAVAQPSAAANDCAHTWLIDAPNGASSLGYCPRCDARREFYNSIPEDKRINNSDLFADRRGGSRQRWNSSSDDDFDAAVRSMYRR